MRFSSARQAIHYYFNHQLMTPENDIEKLWVRVQHTAKGGAACMWLGLELGDLVRPLNRLPALQKSWAMFSYAGQGHWKKADFDRIKDCVTSKYKTSKKKDILDDKHKALIETAIFDFSHRENTGRQVFTDAQLCRQIGVLQQNWVKVWEPKMREMQLPLHDLARESLAPVYARIAEIAEIEKEERAAYATIV